MFYLKNITLAERIARVIAAALLLACGLIAMKGMALGYVVALSGAITLLTGAVGFCPMCAMVGRKPLPVPDKDKTAR